jgi:hypothetical protein
VVFFLGGVGVLRVRLLSSPSSYRGFLFLFFPIAMNSLQIQLLKILAQVVIGMQHIAPVRIKCW